MRIVPFLVIMMLLLAQASFAETVKEKTVQLKDGKTVHVTVERSTTGEYVRVCGDLGCRMAFPGTSSDAYYQKWSTYAKNADTTKESTLLNDAVTYHNSISGSSQQFTLASSQPPQPVPAPAPAAPAQPAPAAPTTPVPVPPKAIDAKPEDASKYQSYAEQALKQNNLGYYREYTALALGAYRDQSIMYRQSGDTANEKVAYKGMADAWVQLAEAETRAGGSEDTVRIFLNNAAEHYEKSGSLEAGDQSLYTFYLNHEKDKYGGVSGDVLASYNPPKPVASTTASPAAPAPSAAPKQPTPAEKRAADYAALEKVVADAKQEMNDAAFALGVYESEYNSLKGQAVACSGSSCPKVTSCSGSSCSAPAMDSQAVEDAKRRMEDARIRMNEAQARMVRAEGKIKQLDLQSLQEQYSKETDPAKKAELKSQIDALQKEIDGQEAKVAAAEQAAAKARMDAMSGRQIFFAYLSDFMRGYSEYSGLGGLAALFISDKELEQQRKAIEDAFCDTLLLGGTRCWSSTICGKQTRFAPGNGVATTETPRGAPRVIAHIEGERSPAAEFNNTREYLYKVTYALSPSLDEEEAGNYNVVFLRADGSEYLWFNPEQTLESTVTALATAPILSYSFNEYISVCLRFSPSIITFDGREVSEICNDLVQQEGSPTKLNIPAPTGGTTTPDGRPPGQGF